jgi:uncharacterized circularly permuted ATP-grasp superfamily protein
MNYEQALARHNEPRPHFQTIAGETAKQQHDRFNAEIAALQPYFKRSDLNRRLTSVYQDIRFETMIWHMHHNPRTLEKLAKLNAEKDKIEQELKLLA